MSGLVLIVGALMLAAGGYEMFTGSGDILSERGWSAFIAGSVLAAGGVVTMALGLAVRAIERLRGAILRHQPAAGNITVPTERIEPVSPFPAAAPAAAPIPQPDLFPEPVLEQAPTAPMLTAAPIEHAPTSEPHPAAADTSSSPYVEPEPLRRLPPIAVDPEPHDDDWLDHSFAELEREMAVRHEPAAAAHPEAAVAIPEPVLFATPDPTPAPGHEPHPLSGAHEEPSPERDAHEPAALETHPRATNAAPDDADAEQATISAREAPVAVASAVIGRYESEGTSYVMYADGSIDAQSEAGVYRFASMTELKAFIES